MVYQKEVALGGATLSIEMGRLAKQANGAAVVRLGDTVVLVTACAAKTERQGIDFLPLTVDYRENFYASGKIPGGFFKREGRPNEKEVLTSRLIDRPLRPLFPQTWRCETQVVGFVLSSDKENDSDTMAITGASAALYCSDIPFTTPIAAVRVGLFDEGFVINPKIEELGVAHEAIRKLIEVQEELYREIQPTKRLVSPKTRNEDVYRKVEESAAAPLLEAMRLPGKLKSQQKIDELITQSLEAFPEEETEQRSMALTAIRELEETILRSEVLKNKRRLDGRRFDEIRAITCEVGALPRTHGSSVFTRGETQALVTVTLGTSQDVQKLDLLEGVSQERFMLHR